MRKKDNILVETSEFFFYKGLHKLMENIGEERILFGSCMPIQQAASMLSKIKDSSIREEEKEKILGLNASQLFKIKS